MKKQIVLAILLVAAVGYLGYVYWPYLALYLPGQAEKTAKPAPAAKVPPVKPASDPTTTLAKAKETQPEKEGKATPEAVKVELTDPFALRISVRSKSEPKPKPKEEQKEAAKVVEPELEGIWVDSGMRVAFISGQALAEGGTILGWRVKKITKTYVLLVKGTKRKTLKLEGQ